MAEWKQHKVDPNTINGGQEFTVNDNLARNELNAMVNNSFYASNIAESVANQISNLDPNEKIEFKGSNPNLLINGDFRINQRGQTSYISTSTGVIDVVDGWTFGWGDGELTIFDKGIKISTTSNFINLQYSREDTPIFTKTGDYTISVYGDSQLSNFFSQIAISYIYEGPSKYLSYGSRTNENGVITSVYNISGSILNEIVQSTKVTIALQLKTCTDVEIYGVKLEVGSISTSFSPSQYEKELAGCQNIFAGISKTYSNPNLIINGDFRVNQRGWSTGNTANAYTVDRWKLGNSTYGTVTVNSDRSVTISASGGTGYLIQRLEAEDGNSIKGKMVTLSACDIDGNIYSKSGIAPSTTAGSSPSLLTSWGYLRLYYNSSTNMQEVTIHVFDGKSITLKWVKLEYGSVATLFSPRPYAEEFALCQRFGFPITGVNGTVLNGYSVQAGDAVVVSFRTPTAMRTSPTFKITTTQMPTVRYGGNDYNVTAVTSDGYKDGTINLRYKTETSIGSRVVVSSYGLVGYIDAEL